MLSPGGIDKAERFGQASRRQKRCRCAEAKWNRKMSFRAKETLLNGLATHRDLLRAGIKKFRDKISNFS
jgi:hypothetical protein